MKHAVVALVLTLIVESVFYAFALQRRVVTFACDWGPQPVSEVHFVLDYGITRRNVYTLTIDGDEKSWGHAK